MSYLRHFQLSDWIAHYFFLKRSKTINNVHALELQTFIKLSQHSNVYQWPHENSQQQIIRPYNEQ